MCKLQSSMFSVLLLIGCHSLNNHNDTLAVQCDLKVRSQGKVLLKFTNPGGLELSPEQAAQLKVQYQGSSQTEESLAPTASACVALPQGEALVKAQIRGKSTLTADIKLDAQAATDTIHTVELESPGVLELGLKCPTNGLLAASTLDDVVEVKKAIGKLNGYHVAIGIFSRTGEKVQDLFLKNTQDSSLHLPQQFHIQNLAEGSYNVRLSVLDSYHEGTQASAESQCTLTVRRSCAKDEDFDPATLSCVPRLCENAYRVGAKWTESLAQRRGEGRYECRLVNEKAEKTLLSHTCQAGYFQGPESCLGAKQIASNCALLETDDVVCWGTMLGKDNFPSQKEVNYRTTLRFQERVKKFGDRCVELESGKVHCWELVLGENVHFDFMRSAGTPKTWDAAISHGSVVLDQACAEPSANGTDCNFKVIESNGENTIVPEPRLVRSACLVDTIGQAWCFKSALPKVQDLASTIKAGPYFRVDSLPGPVRKIRADSYSSCAIVTDGKVICWGKNEAGDVGNNASDLVVQKPAYVVDSRGRVLQNIIQLTSVRDGLNNRTTMALSLDGRVFGWGSNLDGYLANASAGEDDEGNALYTRFAVPLMVELTKPIIPPKAAP